jgi:hypothetical protein
MVAMQFLIHLLGMGMVLKYDILQTYLSFFASLGPLVPPLAIERGNPHLPEEVCFFYHPSATTLSLTLFSRVSLDFLRAFKTERNQIHSS